MRWFSAWWRQIAGAPRSNPWQDDPRIQVERAGQHDRINKATPSYLRKSMEERQARNDLLDMQGTPRGESHGC